MSQQQQPDSSQVFTDLFKITQTPGGADMLKEWSDELTEFNQKKLSDPSLPMPPEIKSKMDAVMSLNPGAWKALMEEVHSMFGQLIQENGGEE